MDEIVKRLVEVENSLELARKMVDWGEYERDPQSFATARLTIRNAIDEISSIRKSLKIITKGGDRDGENQKISHSRTRFTNHFAPAGARRRTDQTIERRKDDANELEH